MPSLKIFHKLIKEFGTKVTVNGLTIAQGKITKWGPNKV